MTRSELKQLIRETIEEISADTARRAADKASQLGRHKQSDRLAAAAQKKDNAAVGGDPSLGNITIDGEDMGEAKIVKIGKTPNGNVGIDVMANGYTYTLVDGDPQIKTFKGRKVAVERPARMKLIKAFKAGGVSINPNKINVID
jgi:hypothetical protein